MHEHDAVMDAYAYVLEALRDNECARLRAYKPAAGARFETWLLVVSRRLALDHVRRRFGRSRSNDPARREEQHARRNLVDNIAAEMDPDAIPDTRRDPTDALRRAELHERLRLCIADLPARDRLLLALRFEDQRPVRDIARALRLPTVFHVYRRLAAVLHELRVSLARHGVDDPEP